MGITLAVCASLFALQGEAPLRYTIEVRPEEDLYEVELVPGKLTADDRYFDFVAFAPGVHSVLNFGRFVQEIEALDESGEAIAVEPVHMNRWEIKEPERVVRIRYAIEDTFDTEISEHRVLPCAGSGIDTDYTLLNTFAVLGYFENHLARPVELALEHDPAWTVGSALTPDEDGLYRAPSYRRLVDSPFLIGDLTTVGIFVGDIEVDIFVHSPTPRLDAEEVLFVAGDILEAAYSFLEFSPVDRYVFLLDFFSMDTMRKNHFRSMGALEHSFSSLYTFPAMGNALQGLAGTLAHEFMHILTPLHLRSTIIAEFDYSIPTTDQHLWLYEGVTEWSADILRLRSGLISLEEYLDGMSQKIRMAESFGTEYSLGRLSLEWSTPSGLRQYGNIYQLGALTGMMLDLRLLELSKGTRGLREVFIELIERFGVERPFDDATFRDQFIEATYPEIATFMRDHIEKNDPLAYEAAFSKLGIEYRESDRSFHVDTDASEEALALREAWMTNLPKN